MPGLLISLISGLKHAEKYYRLKNLSADTPYLNSGKTWHRRQNRVIMSQADLV